MNEEEEVVLAPLCPVCRGENLDHEEDEGVEICCCRRCKVGFARSDVDTREYRIPACPLP